MFEFTDLVLTTVIDDELVNRSAVGTTNHNLVLLRVIVIGSNPVSLRNYQGSLMTLITGQGQLPVLTKAIPGFPDQAEAVLAVNIIEVVIKHHDHFLEFFSCLPFQLGNQEDDKLNHKD